MSWVVFLGLLFLGRLLLKPPGGTDYKTKRVPRLAATTMGLACLALEGSPSFPTYPERMLDADVSAGLVLPNAAVALLGKGGAACTLLLIFMAVTSASSAELIAVSSIFTYDFYHVRRFFYVHCPSLLNDKLDLYKSRSYW
jgi:hypothetical protein